MCDVIGAVAAVVSVGSAVASYSQQQDAANKQGKYNAAVKTQQTYDRLDAMSYQNEVWAQDLDYSRDMLSWAEEEFDRNKVAVTRATRAIEKNTLAATGQLLLRQVEEDMATIMQGADTRTRGAQARAQIAVQDRGVEGNSVDAIINDVTRQEGETMNALALNRSASMRQLNRQIIEADAQGDQQLANLSIKTYATQSPIRTPAPINSVMPAAPVQGGNVGQLVSGVAGGVAQGFTTSANVSGQTTAQTYSQAGNWLSRQFTVTPAGGT